MLLPVAVVYNSDMESANRWSLMAGTVGADVRVATQADARTITNLLRDAPFSHIHADWHYPAEWLGKPSFVVVPASGSDMKKRALSSGLFGAEELLQACLAVAADPKPAAWVRVAAFANKDEGRELMASMLSAMIGPLHEEKTSQIAWLLLEEWPESWLPDLGFEIVNEVITYRKLNTDAPRITRPSDLAIRPAETEDLAALADIESRAFEPLWQHSQQGLLLAKRQALSFDVACVDEKPIGFQFSSSTLRGAHLSRITVDPAAQKSGIGSALLAHALEGYARQGISTVTLNTQLDNIASQNLYERFGFLQSGERFPVWSCQLAAIG